MRLEAKYHRSLSLLRKNLGFGHPTGPSAIGAVWAHQPTDTCLVMLASSWGKAETGFHRLERTQLRHQPPPSYLSILVLLVTGSDCYLGLGRKARYCATLRPSFLCRPICTHRNAYQLYNSNCRCILIHALNFLFLPYVAIIRVFTVKSSSKEMGGGFVTHLPLFRWTRCPSVQNQIHGFSLRVCSKFCVQIRKESLELWGRHVSATCLDRAQNKYQWFFGIPPGMISVLAS